jgi:protease-4
MQRNKLVPSGLLIFMIVIAVVIGGIGLLFIGAIFSGDSVGKPHVAVISFYGAIADSQGGGVLRGGTTPQDFIEDISDAGKDDSVKAIVIRINSPGGSPAASQEMYEAIRRARAKKPIYCSMGDVAASGGYYISSACDKIYADPATLTGSIGVISEFMDFQGLMQKLGVKSNVMVTGKYKDSGSPFRDLRPDERQLFHGLLMNLYNQFVNDVVDGRKEATAGKLTRAKVLSLATGRVYTGEQAKKNLLIDELGGLHAAIMAAAKKAGINGEPDVVEMGGGKGLGSLFGSSSFSGGISAVANTAGDELGRALAKGLTQELQQQAHQQAASPTSGKVSF